MSEKEKKECGCKGEHEHCNHGEGHEHCNHNHEHCNHDHEHGHCNHNHEEGHECCCHHHEEEEGLPIVALVDDKGVEHNFYHLDTVEYKEEYYVVLQPSEKIEGIEDDEVLIYLLDTKGDEDELVPVEDEKLLNAVFDEWVKNMESEE